MKKSKVIVPAMALLLFSTAASITGTVAWFTSVRTFDTSVGDFEVTKLDGNLACEMSALYGTKKVGDDISLGDPSHANHAVRMGDASFDHQNKTLYTNDPNGGANFVLLDTMAAAGTGGIDGFAATNSSAWLYNTVGTVDSVGTKEYYYAVAWNMKFSFEFVAEARDVNVFFNYKESSMAVQDGDGGAAAAGNTNDAAKGFRIAFLSRSATKVWGEKFDGSAAVKSEATYSSTSDTAQYVNGVGSDSIANYSASSFIGSSEKAAAYTKAVDADSNSTQTSRLDYIGTIVNAAGTANDYVVVTCVAWFEGTSKNVVDLTRFAKITASMHFYACVAGE